MRALLLPCLLLSLAACSDEEPHSNAFDFTPPTAQTRKDFIDGIGRRFNRQDRDHDGVLVASEFPKQPGRLERWDTNKDGKVPLDEFRAADIARFAAADTDHDTILTSAEKVRAKWSDARGRPRN